MAVEMGSLSHTDPLIRPSSLLPPHFPPHTPSSSSWSILGTQHDTSSLLLYKGVMAPSAGNFSSGSEFCHIHQPTSILSFQRSSSLSIGSHHSSAQSRVYVTRGVIATLFISQCSLLNCTWTAPARMKASPCCLECVHYMSTGVCTHYGARRFFTQ